MLLSVKVPLHINPGSNPGMTEVTTTTLYPATPLHNRASLARCACCNSTDMFEILAVNKHPDCGNHSINHWRQWSALCKITQGKLESPGKNTAGTTWAVSPFQSRMCLSLACLWDA